MRVRNAKMSLDDYVDFILSHNQIDLTANSLNQIINMHGFKKIHKVQKKVLTDALDTVDLIDPSRSTLKETITSSACITHDDIVADLNELNWQECCVSSIQTLNSSKHNYSTAPHLSIPISKPNKRLNGGGYFGGLGLGVSKLVPKRKRSGVRTRGGRGGGGCWDSYYGSGSSSGLVSFGSC